MMKLPPERRHNADEANVEVCPHDNCVDGWLETSVGISEVFSFCSICCEHNYLEFDIAGFPSAQCIRCGTHKVSFPPSATRAHAHLFRLYRHLDSADKWQTCHKCSYCNQHNPSELCNEGEHTVGKYA